MEKVKHFSLFSGIESFKKALTNLGIDNELVGFSEFDKYATVALAAIHGVSEELNYGDITKIDETKLPDCNLITYGFPCQDISVAGLGKGIIEGETRSGLLFDALRIIKYKKPKYAIAENVKNLVGKKFKEDFEGLLTELESYGYNNYWQVLNAKDYGIPQNRERVFIVSIRKDVDNGEFEFPVGFDNGLRLKDFLENEVDEKFYIALEKTERLISQLKNGEITKMNTNPSGKGINGYVNTSDVANTITTNKGEGPKICVPCIIPDRVNKSQNGRRFKENGDLMFTLTGQDRHGILEVAKLNENRHSSAQNSVLSSGGICTTIDTMQGGNRQPKVIVKQATKLGYVIAAVGDSINLEQPNSKTRRGRVGKQVARTLTTGCNQATLESDYRIRKLTPKECWRLMGFTDEDYFKAKSALEERFYKGKDKSNSQMYKMAGNSIVVNVLEGILRNLLKSKEIAYEKR